MAASPSPSASLIADHAYHELRHRIVTLQLRPGTALREDELMADLGIGRTPLREAVKRLSHESLVAIQPRRGTFVSDVDAADIVHITEVRAELEGFAAALAARRMQRPGRERAEAMLREVEELGRIEEADALMQVDERIHHFVWEESGNP
jgi:DNA-binding GntR family transcriptional regulator